MSPVFAHGQLRLYLLALLVEGPRHGYEIIQQLEARFGGLYSPSAGTVYPRLAKLEEEGLVVRSDEGRKATYAVTDAGRAEVQARAAEIEALQHGLDQSVRELADQVREQTHGRAAGLRAELAEAARIARAQAQARPADAPASDSPGPGPAGGGSARPSAPTGPHGRRSATGEDWPWAAATDWVDLDLAVGDLRRQARSAWRRHGLSAEQTREIIDIVAEASRRISEVLRRPS